jgi:large subunit ribosomal protein L13e
MEMAMKGKIEAVVYTPTIKPSLRSGRGFSLKEIKEAGLTPHDAKRLKLIIDKRRNTAHPQNIQTLKQRYESLISPAKTKERRKKTRKTSKRKAQGKT